MKHALLASLVSVVCWLPAGALTAEQEAKLTASDAAVAEYLARSVAISGDTAVAGAPIDDHAGGTNAGSAYVFVRSGTGWSQQAKLTASDAAGGDWFGISVALSGDTAVVGAYTDYHAGGLAAGSAYVFVRSGTSWSEQAKLTASDAAGGDSFGLSVALSGDTAVVGAPGDNHTGETVSGSAYVFVRSGASWSEQAKLTANDAAGEGTWVQAVAISGDTAVMAAYDDSAPAAAPGSAYVFVRSGTSWSEQAKLTASDAAAEDRFGTSLALSGDIAVVGAPRHDHVGGTNAGSAYVFVRGGTSWSEQAKLTGSDAAAEDRFGISVALSGDTAVAGAPNADHVAPDAGAAYVFRLYDDDVPATGVVGTVVLVLAMLGSGLYIARRRPAS
jgi:hypothetical protein